MKKRFALAFAAILALCLALVGCGGGGGETPADPSANFVGTWEISGMTQDGETYGEEEIEMMREYGLMIYLEFYEDGTFSLELFGEANEGTWEATSASEVVTSSETLASAETGRSLQAFGTSDEEARIAELKVVLKVETMKAETPANMRNAASMTYLKVFFILYNPFV